MPRIPDKYLDCAVYLYPSELAARDGVNSGGTGFLISVPSAKHEDIQYIYAVTNSHIIENGKPVIRLNTKGGEAAILPLEVKHWDSHQDGDDIAVSFLGTLPDHYQIHAIPTDMFLHEEAVKDYLIGPGDDVFMVGRFFAYDGKQRNTPSVRFGNIAMMPGEPIYQQDRNRHQESFLVEMRSLAGFSGSAVFRYDAVVDVDMTSVIFDNSAHPPVLLGIDWGHITTAKGENANMTCVVPAWKLIELLDEVEMQREDQDKKIQREKNEQGKAVLDQLDEIANTNQTRILWRYR